ncbi:MAG: VWA domain-containing protein [Cyanobacteria bacterium]|nr:VWA domain-containing protein [Cyanobacteriota bacterium]
MMIILDGSLSMAERLENGESKMVVAKRVILDLLRTLPPNVHVGFRVYGLSSYFRPCRSTESLVAIGTNNRFLIANKVAKIQPNGATPISFSLSTSINQDFIGLNGKKTIVLVSDGAESCSSDPCEVTINALRQGVNVKINTIGLGISNDYDAERQLKCVAAATWGQFYTANTAAELAKSLRQATRAESTVQGKIVIPKR